MARSEVQISSHPASEATSLKVPFDLLTPDALTAYAGCQCLELDVDYMLTPDGKGCYTFALLKEFTGSITLIGVPDTSMDLRKFDRSILEELNRHAEAVDTRLANLDHQMAAMCSDGSVQWALMCMSEKLADLCAKFDALEVEAPEPDVPDATDEPEWCGPPKLGNYRGRLRPAGLKPGAVIPAITLMPCPDLVRAEARKPIRAVRPITTVRRKVSPIKVLGFCDGPWAGHPGYFEIPSCRKPVSQARLETRNG